MPTAKTLPATNTLVTVRVTDTDGEEHTFHGTFMGTREYVTHVTEQYRGDHYMRIMVEPNGPDLTDADHPAQTFARVYSATGNPMPTNGLPKQGPDHWFGYAEIFVDLDSENVTLTKATKAGHAWVQANQSLDNRRRALAEQVKALDPALGEAVDRLFGDIEEDAFDRGKDYEWRATND